MSSLLFKEFHDHFSSFEALISPISIKDFFGIYWENKYFHISRENPDFYKALLDIDEINQVMKKQSIDYPHIYIYNPEESAVKTNPSAYVDNKSPFIGRLNFNDAHSVFTNGATMVIRNFSINAPRLKSFCSYLDYLFGFHFEDVLFVTPFNSQGFQMHYDPDDLFILQTFGEKRWYLVEHDKVKLPIKLLRDHETRSEIMKELKQKKAESVLMKQGDFMYLPRGVFHYAVCEESPSAHLTIGMVESSICSSLSRSKFGDADKIFSQNCSREIKSTFSYLVKEKIQKVSGKELVKNTAHYLGSKQNLINLSLIAQVAGLSEVNESTLFSFVRNQYLVIEQDPQLAITLGKKKIHFAASLIKVWDFILSRASFSLGDLGLIGDTEHDHNQLIHFIAVLFREGLIKPA